MRPCIYITFCLILISCNPFHQDRVLDYETDLKEISDIMKDYSNVTLDADEDDRFAADMRRLNIDLIVIGIGNFLIENSIWISVAWITVGFLSIFRILTIRNKNCLLLENKILTVNWMFSSKEYPLNELKDIIEHKNKLTLNFQDSKKIFRLGLQKIKSMI